MYIPDEFQEWKEHPVTKEFVKTLRENVQRIKEDMGAGGTISTDAQA
ncbi:hypothetical protein GWN42_07690, partial [candidate division KSB1 bacterium]|nr:hypothetical protein [candidate division KSB1 bacterium]